MARTMWMVALLVSSFMVSVSVLRAQDALGVIDSAPKITCPKGAVSGGTCYAVKVSCPEVADYTAYLKIIPVSSPVGMVLLGTGGTGTSLFEGNTYGPTAISELLAAGYTVAEISFGAPFVSLKVQPIQGWQTNTNGAGMRKAACRYATIATWMKQTFAASQPFCASGNSAGAALIGYGLAYYALDQGVFNFALLTSGPPFSRLDYACNYKSPKQTEDCSNVVRNMSLGIPDATNYVDPAYSPTYSAACSSSIENHSTALDSMFLADSIDSGNGNLNYAITVNFLFGGQDTVGTAINQGEYYRNSITSPTASKCIADAPHVITDALDGAEAIASELINSCQ